MAWNQTPTNQLRLHFVDYNGKRSSMNFHLADDEIDPAAGGAAAIADAAQSCSDAELSSQEIIITGVNDSPAAATTGPYARGADKALIVFRSEDGTPVTLEIGAPNETILEPDHLNVDFSDASVIALVNLMLANACDAGGGDLVATQRGYRRRPPRRKHK